MPAKSSAFPIYLKDDSEEDSSASARSNRRSGTSTTSKIRSRRVSREIVSMTSTISEQSFNASDAGQLSFTSADGKSPTGRRDSTLSLFGRGGRSSRRDADENSEGSGQVNYKPRVPIDFDYKKISSWVIATRSDWSLRQLEETNVEELTEAVGKLAHVRLDGQGITKIENLEPVANSATHLGLHNNFISKIENLAILVHLRYLNLAHNQISVVENLSPLKALQCLDVSQNKIDFLPPEELASSLNILSSNGNPLRGMDHWAWRSLLRALPMLRHHDGKDVSELLREHFPPEDDSPLLPGNGTVQADSDLLSASMRVAPVPAQFLPAYGGVGLINAHSSLLENQRKNNQTSRWTQELQGRRVQERDRQHAALSSLRVSVAASLKDVTSSLSSFSSSVSSSRRATALALAPPPEPLAGLPPSSPPLSSSRPSSPRYQRSVPLLG